MSTPTQTLVRLKAGPTTTMAPGPHDHLTKPLAILHASCIEKDHSVVDFLPPLDIPLMTRWWQSRIDEVGAGTREIIAVVEQAPAPDGDDDDDDGSGSQEAFVAAVVMVSFPVVQTAPMRGLVQKLLVSPKRRRQGLARKVMAEMERAALERGKWHLTLDAEVGAPSELVYPRLGYEDVGVVPSCEISPEDGRLISCRWFWKDLRKTNLIGQVQE
ncbi:hypothetical protein N3K66_004126 [Trichothecium roseum]|uniref:Uncharacterized protein n=1 Tax=Trichothecium roseum TaxID=47278 RepID=A0ACC0V0D5_9HYPO|nr:hypothetical protein N3K66_004126 [Trichothecium roseum]